MPTEIERKYLLRSDAWRNAPRPNDEPALGTPIRQGYLSDTPGRTVRLRLAGERAWLTIKGAPLSNSGAAPSRAEFEYPIPAADARIMLDTLCPRPHVDKTRHRRIHAGHVWEIDVFHAENQGLIVAEIELASVDEQVHLPDWIGSEVTQDARYANSALTRKPFAMWT
jgi:CYTH domain-containing protein